MSIRLVYSSIRAPSNFLRLFWRSPDTEWHPVPADWFRFGKEDLARFRQAGRELDEIHLENQSGDLLERVEVARRFYLELRSEWEKERTSNP